MPGQPNPQGRLVAWLAVAMLAIYCLFWGGAWAATYYNDLRVWALIPAFAGVGIWILIAARKPAWRPQTVLAPAFVAGLGAFVICSVTSREPRFSVEYLALAVLLTALYLILQRLMASPFFAPRMLALGAIAALATGIAYLAVVVPHWITWWGLIGRLAAPPLRPNFEGLTLGNPSAVMTMTVVLAAPAIATLSYGKRSAKVAAGGLAGLAGLITLVSGSRAGWLAIGAAMVIVVIWWLAAPERRGSLARMIGQRSTRIFAVALAVVGIAAAAVAGPGLLLRAADGGDGGRPTYFATAVRMFESSPLVGTGPGTWVPQRIAYTQTGETDYYIPHAHNLYLQGLAEFGFVGLVAGVVILWSLGRLLLGAIRDRRPERRRIGWAALFITVYLGAHQMLDFYANSPAILFAFAIPIAWLDATATPNSRSTLNGVPRVTRLGPAVKAAGVTAVVAAAAFIAWSEAGASLMDAGTSRLNDGRPAEAIAPLTTAVELDPAMPPYHFALGLALARTGDLAGAEEQFSRAAAMDGLPEAWLDLAAVRARLGEPAPAKEAVAQALRLGDQQPAVALGAGVIALELGDSGLATRAFATTLSRQPTMAGDPWWQADPTRAAIWDDVYRAAFEQASVNTQFVLAIEAGDASGVQRAIEMMDPATATTYRVIQRAWEGDGEALDQLARWAMERPFDITVINWSSLILRRSGDVGGANGYTIWANAVSPLSSPGGFEARVTERGEPGTIAGVSTLFYGHYTYRRPIPSDQFVDWLPQIAYR
jgi:O-antigen ligase